MRVQRHRLRNIPTTGHARSFLLFSLRTTRTVAPCNLASFNIISFLLPPSVLLRSFYFYSLLAYFTTTLPSPLEQKRKKEKKNTNASSSYERDFIFFLPPAPFSLPPLYSIFLFSLYPLNVIYIYTYFFFVFNLFFGPLIDA